MIGADPFTTVFGGEPGHTSAHLSEHLRAIIRAGFSPVLCAPETASAVCILGPVAAARPHQCGASHVLDNPSKVAGITLNWAKRYSWANVGLHLGRSHLAVLIQPAAPGMTVETPTGWGHWWYLLPEGAEVSSAQGQGWTLLAGNHYVLVPPSQIHQGRYQLVGGAQPAPEWLTR